MDINTYQWIYNSVQKKEDIIQVSKNASLPVGVVATILNQKVTTIVKKNYHKIKSKSEKHLLLWNSGLKIIDIAKNNDIPSTLMASMILKEMGYPKQTIFKNMDAISDYRLKIELEEVIKSDIFYSPLAQKMKYEKGFLGEKLIQEWLLNQNISFFTESDLRSSMAKKTPDFLLKESIKIDSTKVEWIESKAMFGCDSTHKYYLKKQLKEYEELYGVGMVVYWYGFIEHITMNQNIIKDYNFFYNGDDDINGAKKEIDSLLNWM